VGYRLGIDLGASFTVAVVVSEEGTARPVALGDGCSAMPTAVHIDAAGAIRCGDEALAGFARDQGEDRLVRRFLARIGDGVPITVGPADGEHLRLHPQDIAAAMVSWVLARVTTAEGTAPDHVALVHPSTWAAHKTELMERALAIRGLDSVRLIGSVPAAGLVYAGVRRPARGELFAVLDVGGATTTAAVLQVDSGGNPVPVGRPAARSDLGGVDFDDAVLNHLLEALEPTQRQVLTAATHPAALENLRQACRLAKEQLSSATAATLVLEVSGRRTGIRITRAEFEARIADHVRRSIDVLMEGVSDAGLRPADLRGVILCGGSTAVPLITQQLTARLGPGVALVREPDPVLTVALGAALAVGAAAEPPQPEASVAVPATARPAVPAPSKAPGDPVPVGGGIPATAGARRVRLLPARKRVVADVVPAPVDLPDEVPTPPPVELPAAEAHPDIPERAPEPEPAKTPTPETAPLGADEAPPAWPARAARMRPRSSRHPVPTGPGAAPDTTRGPLAVRSVVAPRELGSVQDLLQLTAPRPRRTAVRPVADPPGDVAPEPIGESAAESAEALETGLNPTQGEDLDPVEAAEPDDLEPVRDASDVEDFESVRRPLWRRGLTVCTGRRVVVVVALTAALFVGADAWRAATPAITGGGHISPATNARPPATDPAGSGAPPAASTHTQSRAHPLHPAPGHPIHRARSAGR